ncbi:hypothetical protein [Yoonia sp.]|uniref:hypothetical protein n=1 Tax=Yoonia sp. TaxID=2212373 RepID=UPI003919C5D4
MPNLIAALTGDIIKSRKAPPQALEQTFALLQQAAADFGGQRGLDLRFTRNRGDGWQVVLTDPTQCFDAILFVIASLRAGRTGLDTRISAAIAPVDTLGTRDLADASGDAFFIAGDQLDQMPRADQIALAGVSDAHSALVDLAVQIASRWTAAQAQAVAMALLDPAKTHDDIAARLGITRQAVQNRLASAGFGTFNKARAAMRNLTPDTTP